MDSDDTVGVRKECPLSSASSLLAIGRELERVSFSSLYGFGIVDVTSSATRLFWCVGFFFVGVGVGVRERSVIAL